MGVIYAKPPLDVNDTSPRTQVGTITFDDNGNAYRYVRVVDLDVENGDVVEVASTSQFDVTKDRSGGSSVGRVVAGVAVSDITAGNYGWIMVSGIHSAVKTDGGVTGGQFLIPHATSDGVADSGTAGTNDYQAFGFALADDTASNIVQAVIKCL